MNSVQRVFQKRFNVSDLRPQNTKMKKVGTGFFKLHEGGSLKNTWQTKGRYALVASEGGRLKDIQINEARNRIRRTLKPIKGSQYFIMAMPTLPVTKKPAETRMGKGKGNIDHYACWVDPEQVIFELDHVPKEIAEKAIRIAGDVFHIRTHFKQVEALTPTPTVIPLFIQQRLERWQFINAKKVEMTL